MSLGPITVVANPAAARMSGRLLADVARELGPLGVERVARTEGSGDARRLAAEAARSGAGVVVVVGGDGTIAHVASALAGTEVALAPVPAGGANVLARALGWPAHPRVSLAGLARSVAAGRVRRLRLGCVRAGGHAHAVIVNAGVGLDGSVVEWVERHPRWKRTARIPTFAVAVARSVSQSATNFAVSIDGGPEQTASALMAAVGCPYTYLGPRALELVPRVDFDGRLAYLALERHRRRAIVSLLGQSLVGHAPRHPLARSGIARESIVVRGARVAVQADGEPLGRHDEITIGPGAMLRVVVPAAPGRLKDRPEPAES